MWGKTHDIFAGKGIGETIRTSGNTEGLQVTLDLADRDFEGLAFVNLVDFDMLYGHRRDVAGYAAAAAEFNDWLPQFMAKMRPEDILMGSRQIMAATPATLRPPTTPASMCRSWCMAVRSSQA